MRTWAIQTAPDGVTQHGEWVKLHDLRDDSIEELLSRVATEAVTIHRPHGSIKYHAIDYECLDCGGYGHAAGSDKCLAQLDDGCPND